MKTRHQALAAAMGILAGIVALELGLRVFQPDLLERAETASVVDETAAHHPKVGLFELDEELIYVPSATNPEYGSHGARSNDFPLQKGPGVTRVVLLGDSVVARQKISEAMRARLDPTAERLEFWALGVEGYDTAQEIAYFRRFGAALDPDLVVLVYSFNDFRTTPLLYLNSSGELIRLSGRDPERIHQRLFRWSYLYRAWILRQLEEPGKALPDGSEHVPPRLAKLASEVEDAGARFCALVQPYLIQAGTLDAKLVDEMYRRHDNHLTWFEDCGIPSYDLAVPVRSAQAEGVTLSSQPGDLHHPSDELARRYVDWLVQETDWLTWLDSNRASSDG